MNFVPFVTTIAWDPTNSCHILVGTMQNGVIRSADGGRTWARVRGSQLAPYVTSFFFPPKGPIWMSTYGRGLWQVMVDRTPPPSGRCPFPQPPGIVVQPEPPILVFRAGGASRPFTGLRDSAVCTTCTVLLVHDGWITDIEGDAEVRAVATSGGHVEQRRRDAREAPATVANSVRYNTANRVRYDESAGLRRRVGRSMTGERHVRGLVLDGRRLVAYVVGSAPLPITPARAPEVVVRARGGDSVQVGGFHFLPGEREGGVTVLAEGDTLASGVSVGADGRFEAHVRVRHPPGWVMLTAVQRDGLRTTLATTNLQMMER
jgi:hypothetical protein